MAVLEILKVPDKRLREKANEITVIDDNIKRLAYDMIETMYAGSGVGLAGTQVGVPLRIIVIDVDQIDGEPNPMVFINPEILEGRDKVVKEEGCLSVPGFTAKIERFGYVKVRYKNLDNETQEMSAEGLLARAFQHEIDHLNGILFIDYLSKLKRELFLKKLKKSLERSL
ncbi:MAG: peptide deformylase [Proteobacteria bacterium]|nr:peptide deformylase [Pseudomonadota bacterium]